mgnify:FL=1
MHLIIDGFNCDPEQIADQAKVLEFLDTYPDSIGMTKIIAPSVKTYKGPKPEDWGVSGFVIIAESHISVHTFPDRRYINIDVFSCKNFDSDLALQQIPNIFSIGKLKHWLLDRGIEHIDPQQAESIIENERSQIVVPDLKSGFKKPI